MDAVLYDHTAIVLGLLWLGADPKTTDRVDPRRA